MAGAFQAGGVVVVEEKSPPGFQPLQRIQGSAQSRPRLVRVDQAQFPRGDDINQIQADVGDVGVVACPGPFGSDGAGEAHRVERQGMLTVTQGRQPAPGIACQPFQKRTVVNRQFHRIHQQAFRPAGQPGLDVRLGCFLAAEAVFPSGLVGWDHRIVDAGTGLTGFDQGDVVQPESAGGRGATRLQHQGELAQMAPIGDAVHPPQGDLETPPAVGDTVDHGATSAQQTGRRPRQRLLEFELQGISVTDPSVTTNPQLQMIVSRGVQIG